MTIFDRPSSSELLKAVIDFIDAEDKDFSISKLADKIKNNEIDVSDQNIIDFLYDLREKKIDIDNPKYKKN